MTTRHDALVPDDAEPGSRVMDVSVLTPSYEYGRFMADGIESVIQQQGLRLQHIIQDTGSGDDTLEVLRSFGDRVGCASETDLGQSDGLHRGSGQGDQQLDSMAERGRVLPAGRPSSPGGGGRKVRCGHRVRGLRHSGSEEQGHWAPPAPVDPPDLASVRAPRRAFH
jgi:glycosyltransferase involved in cell wall biosynthesis